MNARNRWSMVKAGFLASMVLSLENFKSTNLNIED
jgi:hypothetical protein